MAALAQNVVGWLVDWLVSQWGQTSSANPFDAITRLWSYCRQLTLYIGDTLAALIQTGRLEKEAWVDAKDNAAHAADDMTNTAGASRGAFQHLFNRVLPASLAWLDGKLMTHEIVPIKQRLSADESDIRFLLGWRGQINFWRENTVDPTVIAYRNFWDYFKGKPRAAVDTWVGWFEHPGEFGTWAAAPMIGPLIGYLANPDHTGTRDNLTRIIVDVSPRVWRHVEAAAVAVLLTEQ
jgi:hypothetical protein